MPYCPASWRSPTDTLAVASVDLIAVANQVDVDSSALPVQRVHNAQIADSKLGEEPRRLPCSG